MASSLEFYNVPNSSSSMVPSWPNVDHTNVMPQQGFDSSIRHAGPSFDQGVFDNDTAMPALPPSWSMDHMVNPPAMMLTSSITGHAGHIMPQDVMEPGESATTSQHSGSQRHRCSWQGCSTTFKRRYEISRHIRTVHLHGEQVWCPVARCKRSEGMDSRPFNRLDKCNEHVRRVHGKSK